MGYLDEYILEVKKYIAIHPNITELELIRYVYLTLGERLSFNEKFLPFGNSKTRQNMYKYHSQFKNDLEECLKNAKIICKSSSYILEYILRSFKVDIKTLVDQDDIRKCPHVYNMIKQKDGRTYFVDLQEDLYNIQSHYFTKNFGIDSIKEMNMVISRFEQEQIDRKIGYISSDYYYADEYLYLIRLMSDSITDFRERVQFILENIDVYSLEKMGYTDIEWHHKTILEHFFNKDEFDYQKSTGKIRMIDCYKDINGERKYILCISVQTGQVTDIYLYNRKRAKYCKVDISNFAHAVKNGLIVHNCSVPNLNRILKKIN